ncbi:hypothetical protein CGX12_07450 [Zobellella denitrificans]|uniref:hypothetical protein n=1 Tax=Zobellella denitrificans TaxID=347534 RepID=UPI000B8C52B7|nr:hypothetical protein [Zobellella denitrificans]OXS15721.1 hypothetical protein CGX12_07450 [Zobellella denitrificans]
MNKHSKPGLALALVFGMVPLALGAGTTASGEHYGEQLGKVAFSVSCQAQAAALVERGMALLHHMTYEGAEAEFARAAELDPGCAMAYWGQAMSYIHPLWSDPPSRERYQQGAALIDKARAAGAASELEQAFIAAVAAYYRHEWEPDERPRLASFAEGWRLAYDAMPEEHEVMSFYALALIATADPADKSYRAQLEAGRLAEQVLADNPQHPGAHHYAIHAYDYPPLAEKALAVSRRYGEVAPEVPHALHMPSHIFTRAGLWQESIGWNRASAEAALKHPFGDAVSFHYLHALDYLVYAHLQGAEYGKAEQELARITGINGPIQAHAASAYTLAVAPARLALERQQWEQAARLEPRTPADFPWERFPAMEAISHFAKALGAAHMGEPQLARDAIARLGELREAAATTSPYWARQVEIQQKAAEAWLMFLQGNKEEGLQRMRAAAELEAGTEKHPVTPGEVLPARELFGDMLLELEMYSEARAEYEAALARSANRFNSLYGAGRAAELAGDREGAAGYYRRLVELAAQADTEPARLNAARQFLARP